MLQAKSWIAKLARLYDSDRRCHVRIPADFQATIASPFRTLDVHGVDAHRDGVGVQSAEPLEEGTLVFLRITDLGLMGFAHVRHCSRRGDGFILGLQFRERLAREHRIGDGWDCQQLAQSKYRMWDEPDA